jgi:hypothetical protein
MEANFRIYSLIYAFNNGHKNENSIKSTEILKHFNLNQIYDKVLMTKADK